MDRESIFVYEAKADLVDMEGFAIAYVTQKYNQQVIFIKTISDRANSFSKIDLFKNLKKAMINSIQVLEKIIALEF